MYSEVDDFYVQLNLNSGIFSAWTLPFHDVHLDLCCVLNNHRNDIHSVISNLILVSSINILYLVLYLLVCYLSILMCGLGIE